jgi:hypothetical protein
MEDGLKEENRKSISIQKCQFSSDLSNQLAKESILCRWVGGKVSFKSCQYIVFHNDF